jgi:DNA-binding MarR family transcriptional regulator
MFVWKISEESGWCYISILKTTQADDVLNALKEIKSNKGRWKMEDKKKLVLDAFVKAGKPMRPGDIAKETGIDSKEVSKIIKELRAEGKIDSPKRCYYAPVGE